MCLSVSLIAITLLCVLKALSMFKVEMSQADRGIVYWYRPKSKLVCCLFKVLSASRWLDSAKDHLWGKKLRCVTPLYNHQWIVIMWTSSSLWKIRCVRFSRLQPLFQCVRYIFIQHLSKHISTGSDGISRWVSAEYQRAQIRIGAKKTWSGHP